MLSDKELFFERKQVRLRTLEPTGKSSEKTLAVSELPEFLLQQGHRPERGDSVEAQSSARIGGGPSNLDPFPSNARPPVNVTVLATSKLSGHFKRKIHDAVSLSLSPFPLSPLLSRAKSFKVFVFLQTLTKLLPLLETFPSKQPLEILVVGLHSLPPTVVFRCIHMCMCVYVCVQVDLKSDVLCSLAAEINVSSIDSVSSICIPQLTQFVHAMRLNS